MDGLLRTPRAWSFCKNLALQVLATACLKLNQPTPFYMTPSHGMLTQCCCVYTDKLTRLCAQHIELAVACCNTLTPHILHTLYLTLYPAFGYLPCLPAWSEGLPGL